MKTIFNIIMISLFSIFTLNAQSIDSLKEMFPNGIYLQKGSVCSIEIHADKRDISIYNYQMDNKKVIIEFWSTDSQSVHLQRFENSKKIVLNIKTIEGEIDGNTYIYSSIFNKITDFFEGKYVLKD